MFLRYESLFDHVVEQFEEGIVVAVHVKDADRDVRDPDLVEREHFEEFVEAAPSARREDDRVGMLDELLFPLLHVGRFHVSVVFVGTLRFFFGFERVPGKKSDDLAAAVEGSLGYVAH